MKKEEVLAKIPAKGFLKTVDTIPKDIPSSQRAALIRKGNELFNAGRYDQAKRIFLTVGYSDGISRIGDYHLQQHDTLEALRMYMSAPAPDKTEMLIEKMAAVVQTWLHEKGDYGTGHTGK